MTGQRRTNWPLMSWRTGCGLCLAFWLFWAEAELSPQQANLLTAANLQAGHAVAINFVTPAKLQEKVAASDTTADVPVVKKPLNPDAKTAKHSTPLQPQKKTTKTNAKKQENADKPSEQEIAALSMPTEIEMAGVHDKPDITEAVFSHPPTPPRYPRLARKRGQQGTVLLEIWLDEWGKQSRLSVMKSSGIKVLDEAAIAAVSNWQFEPRNQNGINTKSRVRIPVEFALR